MSSESAQVQDPTSGLSFKVPSLPSSRARLALASLAEKRSSEAIDAEELAAPKPTEPPEQVSISSFPYDPPAWSAPPQEAYYFEVLKGGMLLEPIALISKSLEYVMIGRIPLCHVLLDHPSISRFHAVLQFSQEGRAFLLDLKSSHGTFVNKKRIEPYVPTPLTYGDMLKFGESTRLYIFHGEQDNERRHFEKLEQERLIQTSQQQADRQVAHESENASEDAGISWGMSFNDLALEPEPTEMLESDASWIAQGTSSTTDAVDTIEDPKKYLHAWLIQTGLFASTEPFPTPSYKETTQRGGRLLFETTLDLPYPLTSPLSGACLSLSASGTGARKKEAERNAARQLCRTLQQHGFFEKDSHGSYQKTKRSMLLQALDTEDDEDDEFYDRTKRPKEDTKNKKSKSVLDEGRSVETFETLADKKGAIDLKIRDLAAWLEPFDEAVAQVKQRADSSDTVEMDLSELMSTSEILKYHMKKDQLSKLIQEREKLLHLIDLVRPSPNDILFMQKAEPLLPVCRLEPIATPAVTTPHDGDATLTETARATVATPALAPPQPQEEPRRRRPGPAPASKLALSEIVHEPRRRIRLQLEREEDVVEWLPPDACEHQSL